MPTWMARGLVVIGCLLVGGCGEGALFSTSVWDPLGLQPLFGPGQKPVRIGIVEDRDVQSVLNPISWIPLQKEPWAPLRGELSRQLGRPVVVDRLKPFQIAAHLNSGRIQLALLSASDYLELTQDGDIGSVVALSEGVQRRGVIVAAADSDIHTLQDVKGRRFAWGPRGDAVLHLGTVKVLADAGVTPDDLGKELVPIPGALQHHISSIESAKEILYGVGVGKLRTEVGVIDESDYESFPQTGGSWFPFPTYSKDRFRVLARTEAVRIHTVPDGPVVASRQADPELIGVIRDFLTSAAQDHPSVLRGLGFQAFRVPPADPRAEIERLSLLAAGGSASASTPP